MAFEIIQAEEVKFLRSTLIGVPHGFSTRIGGVSKLAHTSSLNLAFNRGDEPEIVLENLRIFARAVGVEAESVVSHHQIHSKLVRVVDESNRGEGYFVPTDDSCDGYVTRSRGVTLGVKSADCVPILFHEPDACVIGAVHAGWRGTALGIAVECVAKMRELGANPAKIRVAIGAAIRFCCYEVGEDFLTSVSELVGEKLAREFVRPVEGKLHADIVGLNERLLLEAGISPEKLDVAPHCTCHEPELFFSHRASKGLRGTMLSVISL